MHRILWFLYAILMLFSFIAAANPCLNYLNHSGGSCVTQYQYDTLTKRFRDRHNEVHNVTWHVISQVSPQSPGLVQLDLHFRFFCHSDCLEDRESFLNAALWDFRSALIADAFFGYRYCDEEDDSCGEARPARNYDQDDLVKISPMLELQNVAKSSQSKAEFRELLRLNQQAPMMVLLQVSEHEFELCIEQDSGCQLLAGRIFRDDTAARVELNHHLGSRFNTGVSTWLHGWLSENPKPYQCATEQRCGLPDKDGTAECSMRLDCHL